MLNKNFQSTNDFYELIGIVIGDGNLWTKGSNYRVEITGDPIRDFDYFNYYIIPLIKQFTDTKVVSKERSNGLRIRVMSKSFFNKFIKFGFFSGKQKLEKLKFLNEIPNSSRKYVLRGLMDTDGCVIRRSNGQVFMEIATCSKFLANWIDKNLKILGFRSFVTRYTNRKNQTIFRVWLSGKKNIKIWIDLIGFSNKFKFNKASEILKLGQSTTGQYHLK